MAVVPLRALLVKAQTHNYMFVSGVPLESLEKSVLPKGRDVATNKM